MRKQLYLLFLLISSIFASDTQQSFWEVYTAALRGDKIAQFQVGVTYERGIGVDENQSLAAHWFEESARQGYVDAQYNIAIMYAAGRGVAADEGMAMMWLAKAAKQKDVEARKLLLKIIDGELDDHKSKGNKSIDTTTDIVNITPTVLYTKESPSICSSENVCREYKTPMVLTSISKRGEYYKISGTLNKKGWKKYLEEGWIHENSIDHKK